MIANERADRRGEIVGLSSGEWQTVPKSAKSDKFKHRRLMRVKLRPKARVEFPRDRTSDAGGVGRRRIVE